MDTGVRYAPYYRLCLVVIILMHWMAIGLILWGKLHPTTSNYASPNACLRNAESFLANIDVEGCPPAARVVSLPDGDRLLAFH